MDAPSRRRVEDFTEPFLSTYTTVPKAGPGVCRVCRGAPGAGWPDCFSCNRTCGHIARPTRLIVPISLYEVPGQLHTVMRGYKDSPDEAVRARHGAQVASMIGRFLKHHRQCLESAAGARFDSIVVVPSTRARAGPHPLEAAVGRVTSLKGLVQPLLVPGTSPITGHLQADPDGYALVREVSGRAVLLLDDTFTSGARVQSAAHALATGGATVVAALVVGRVIDPAFSDESRALWDAARTLPFSFDTCCLE